LIISNDFKLEGFLKILKPMDNIISICRKCGFTIGIFVPGMECPECGELIFP
tara:strand:+ start:844 stop:999 length:156 start_codon:yes stop_codon:yes gene_type:complete